MFKMTLVNLIGLIFLFCTDAFATTPLQVAIQTGNVSEAIGLIRSGAKLDALSENEAKDLEAMLKTADFITLLPADVLSQVFLDLEPADYHRMTRVSKRPREIAQRSDIKEQVLGKNVDRVFAIFTEQYRRIGLREDLFLVQKDVMWREIHFTRGKFFKRCVFANSSNKGLRPSS